MGAEKSRRDMTDEEVYVDEAIRNVDTVAQGLERLAVRLRETAQQYATVGRSNNEHLARSGCIGVAAELISQYAQGVGNNGTHLWGLVRSAQAVDDHRRSMDLPVDGASELRGEA